MTKQNSKINVLIVDDEAELRVLLTVFVQITGQEINVLTARDGQEAKEMLETEPVDIVLTDLKMPRMNGFDLLKWIKSRTEDRPKVLLMTAFLNELEMHEAFDLGADAVLEKPVDVDSISDVLRSCLIPEQDRWQMSIGFPDKAAKIAVDDSPWQNPQDADRIALGRGGLFLQVREDLPSQGSMVHFRINLNADESELLDGIGIAKWVRTSDHMQGPRGVGIEFLFLTAASRENVVRYLKKYRPAAYIPMGNGMAALGSSSSKSKKIAS